MPTIDDPLEVGFWDKNLENFNCIQTSYAWNYHKGCRLQWLGNSNDYIVFNNFINKKLKSEIYDTSLKKIDELPLPIDTISTNGRYASSFSYRRLEELMPGYGYKFEDNSFLNENHSKKTGIFIIGLNKKSVSMIHNLDNLSKLETSSSMKNARHFVTHSLFSPDSKKIAFLHRWIHNDVAKRYSRLIVSDINGDNIQIIQTDEMVSHYTWDDDSNIIAYCRKDNIDGHYLFGERFNKSKLICKEILNSDGHQHIIPNTKTFVTDTYPNSRRFAKLFIVDYEKNDAVEIASVKSPKSFKPELYLNIGVVIYPESQ